MCTAGRAHQQAIFEYCNLLHRRGKKEDSASFTAAADVYYAWSVCQIDAVEQMGKFLMCNRPDFELCFAVPYVYAVGFQ